MQKRENLFKKMQCVTALRGVKEVELYHELNANKNFLIEKQIFGSKI